MRATTLQPNRISCRIRPGSSSLSGTDVLSLETGQGLQGAESELGIDEERHPGGQQRITPEEGHEPRGARGHHRPLGVIRIEDAQRSEVLGAAGNHRPQTFVVGVEHRHAAPPGRHTLGRLGPLDRLAAQPARLDLVRVDAAGELLAQRPGPLGRDDDLPAGRIAVEHGRLREGDAEGPPVTTVAVAEQQRPGILAHVPLAAVGRTRFLDGKEVGEVSPEYELRRAVRRLLSEVADHQVLAHAPPDIATSLDHQVGVGPVLTGPAPGHEGGGIGIGDAAGEDLGGLSVDPQGPARTGTWCRGRRIPPPTPGTHRHRERRSGKRTPRPA